MSQLQLLGTEKMKYERDGGEYGVIGEWLSTPSFTTWLYYQINAYFETLESKTSIICMTIEFPCFSLS